MTQGPRHVRTAPAVECRHRIAEAIRVRLWLILGVLMLVSGPLPAQHGATTAQANLDQLVQQAHTIVHGYVVSAVMEPHPQFSNLQTVVVTIKVERALKGSAGTTLVFRQFVWDARDVPTLAGYRKSEELLLFLGPVSEYGLTSPVGLEQGRFRILRDAKGNRTAINGRANLGLFDQLPSAIAARGLAPSPEAAALLTQPRGPLPLTALEDLIQTLAGGQK